MADKEDTCSCVRVWDTELPTKNLKDYFHQLGNSANEGKIDLEKIEHFLDEGADINAEDDKGRTFLHEVAKNWHIDVAKFMIERGADVHKGDKEGLTPLHVAAMADYKEMVEFLSDRGAVINLRTKTKRSAVTEACVNNACQSLRVLHCREKAIITNSDLIEAAHSGSVDTCRYLIEKVHIDVNEGYKDGVCPLHIAAMMNQVDVVQLLLNKGACISAKTECCHHTALFLAAANDAPETLAFLEKKGADIHERDCRGRTPLMVAAQTGCSNTCSFLLDHNARTDLIDPSGEPCIVTILTKVPGMAGKALDKFYREDIGNRRRYFYLNYVEPNQPGESHQESKVMQVFNRILAFLWKTANGNNKTISKAKGCNDAGNPCAGADESKAGHAGERDQKSNVEQPGNDKNKKKSEVNTSIAASCPCNIAEKEDACKRTKKGDTSDAGAGERDQESKVVQTGNDKNNKKSEVKSSDDTGCPCNGADEGGGCKGTKEGNASDADNSKPVCSIVQKIRGFCSCPETEKTEKDTYVDTSRVMTFDDPWPKKSHESSLTPMETIVVYRQHDNIRHPVIRKLIKEKWKQFGRRQAWYELIRDLVFIILWTPLSLLRPKARACYYFPEDVYRIVLWVAAIFYSLFLFIRDLNASLRKRRRFEQWKEWKLNTLNGLPVSRICCTLSGSSTEKKHPDSVQAAEQGGTRCSVDGSMVAACCLCHQNYHRSLEERKQTEKELNKKQKMPTCCLCHQNKHHNLQDGKLSDSKSKCEHRHPNSLSKTEETKTEEKEAEDMPAGYIGFAWNYFNWTTYILLIICVGIHIYDVATVPQEICIANAVTNSTTGNDDDETPQTTAHVIQITFFSITIILIWQRIFKSTRAFTQLGPFINKYYNARIDVMRYIFLYSAFLIPYTCIFWMVFGGTVENYITVPETLFSLFRMTLVDDYNYDGLKEANPVACDILVGTFLAIAAIAIIDMFIGALTDSFISFGDEVESNALMTRAWMILDFEYNLSKSERDSYLTHIHKNLAPLEKTKIYKGNKHLKKKPKTTEDTVEELTKIVDRQKTAISRMSEDMGFLCNMYNDVFSIMEEKGEAPTPNAVKSETFRMEDKTDVK